MRPPVARLHRVHACDGGRLGAHVRSDIHLAFESHGLSEVLRAVSLRGQWLNPCDRYSTDSMIDLMILYTVNTGTYPEFACLEEYADLD